MRRFLHNQNLLSLCHKSCIEGYNLSIYPSLPLVDPLATYGFYPIRWIHQRLDLIGLHGLHLSVHYLLPKCGMFILDGFIVVTGIHFRLLWDISQTNEMVRLSNNPPTMTRLSMLSCISKPRWLSLCI